MKLCLCCNVFGHSYILLGEGILCIRLKMRKWPVVYVKSFSGIGVRISTRFVNKNALLRFYGELFFYWLYVLLSEQLLIFQFMVNDRERIETMLVQIFQDESLTFFSSSAVCLPVSMILINSDLYFIFILKQCWRI